MGELSATNHSTGVGQSIAHDSAIKHVTGQALYVDDLPQCQGQLHGAVGQSPVAHGKLISLDLSAVRKAEGVVAVITPGDVPGALDIGPVLPGDPVFATHQITFKGQPLFAVAATREVLARRAVRLAKVEIEVLPLLLNVSQALEQQAFVSPTHQQKKGNAPAAIATATHCLKGTISLGGQEHFYLEGQVALALPAESNGMLLYSSTQHPSEVQALVAKVLNIAYNQVTVDVRRLGGAFGGKETQAAPWACIAALLAQKTQCPVKLRLSRNDDMVMTGKRHPFENHYRVGFDEQGVIQGIEITLNGNCGHSPDLSDAIVDRAMFHSDNAYYLKNATIVGNRCRTHLVSNTAFRGFGAPQGMMTIEAVIDDIARFLGCDPLVIRRRNIYGKNQRNVTHYHQTIEHNLLAEILDQLEQDCDYRNRREKIMAYNRASEILKKGIALTPVKFGVSFTVQHLNQAGALIHLYTDGSIHLNHGGTEMGQGLFTKVAQIVAEQFQVDVDSIAVSATRTDKVPNTSPTAASSSCDLNGKAAQQAAMQIKSRLIAFASKHFNVKASSIRFANNQVWMDNTAMAFKDFIALAYRHRIPLSATGFYRTPKIFYDRQKARGQPFFYFAFGAAASEVLIDTLTGEYKVTRVDILHDVGQSLNPAIDIGQIEGGFIQGLGWLTMEEVKWDETGELLSRGPSTYKIPTAQDMPPVFNVALFSNTPNGADTVYRSKAVGEPPFMLAISVWSALREAIASVADYRISPGLDIPATPERVLKSVRQMQAAAAG